MDFINAAELSALCTEHDIPISEAMIRRELTIEDTTREEVRSRMAHSYEIMKESARSAVHTPRRSMSGLIGGEAHKLYEHQRAKGSLCGSVTSKAIMYAVGVLEVNASMGLIVAAPTAGSSGVIPGAFLAIQEEYDFSNDEMVTALFHAGAVGYLITRNATVAGASGGCQAEVGSAAAMAASALTELMGGDPQACLSAASMAISNLLGLVCDPVAGLVEAPCQSRNAIGVSNALLCAEMALSGIQSLIPFDESVEAMHRVGLSLPRELRETALGGMAATPTACALCAQVFRE